MPDQPFEISEEFEAKIRERQLKLIAFLNEHMSPADGAAALALIGIAATLAVEMKVPERVFVEAAHYAFVRNVEMQKAQRDAH